VVFEEHPFSDRHLLQNTLDKHKGWVGIKNFLNLDNKLYQPFFEPNLVDSCMSYICMHWFDTNDVTDIAGWKTPDYPGSDNTRDLIQYLLVDPHHGMFLMQIYIQLHSSQEKHLVGKEGSNQQSNQIGQPIYHTITSPVTKESHKRGCHVMGWIDSSTKRRK
jgi:hypothetical protein